MKLYVIQTLIYNLIHISAYGDKYIDGHDVIMVEKGKIQYQLLQERGSLPKYGICWKKAVLHIDEGCRALSEETQSDIALHITNCFLEMSGHVTYNCELDKKPNLRGICINSMSDRAFNVYTEFYTHTQNMCWFLRGQLWHETISENTQKVGKQLERSAINQESLLSNQQKSLDLQEKMLQYGVALEKIMENFYNSSKHHQELLTIIGSSLAGLQSWLLGEISWFDTILFYVMFSFLIMLLTSNNRTANARFPMIILLTLNIFAERFICFKMTQDNFPYDINVIHNNYYSYIWYIRYIFITLSVLIIVIHIYYYKDYIAENNFLLHKMYNQMSSITENLNEYKTNKLENSHIEYIKETKIVDDTLNSVTNYLSNIQNELHPETSRKSIYNIRKFNISKEIKSANINACSLTPKFTKENTPISTMNLNNHRNVLPLMELQNNGRYNLRSRQATPDT